MWNPEDALNSKQDDKQRTGSTVGSSRGQRGSQPHSSRDRKRPAADAKLKKKLEDTKLKKKLASLESSDSKTKTKSRGTENVKARTSKRK